MKAMSRRTIRRPLHPLRHPRARHGGGDERHGAAWRHHPVFGGTFLVFSDYCRPAIRLAALMGERVIHVMTHDSIGLGEDGPTHQPVEHLAALRAIPNLHVFRPCRRGRDGGVLAARAGAQRRAERAGADAPEPAAAAHDARRGEPLRRRRLRDLAGRAARRKVSLFATGSEVAIAVDGAEAARRAGHRRRASSRCRASSCSLAQPEADRAARIDRRCAGQGRGRGRGAQGWDAIIGSDGVFVGMTGFGASAPYKDLYKHFGITAEKVAEAALSKLA